MTMVATSTEVGAYRTGERHSMWHHGLERFDGTSLAVLQPPSRGAVAAGWFAAPFDQLPRAIASAGLIHLSIDGGGSCTWGNDDAAASLDDAAAYAARIGARSDRVALLGVSMGAIPVLNWALRNRDRVAGIALVCPAVDLAHIHDRTARYFAEEIEDALGGPDRYRERVHQISPIEFARSLRGLPIAVWRSEDDDIIGDRKVRAFTRAAKGRLMASLGRVGHDFTRVDAAAVASFLASTAQPS